MTSLSAAGTEIAPRAHPPGSTSALLLFLFLFTATTAAARVYEERLFATGEARPRRCAVVPPDVRIVRGRILDSAPLIKESAAFEDLVAAEVASYLAAQGYEADFESLSVPRLAANPELSTLVLTAKDRYGEATAHASRDPRDIADGRFSIGESAAPVAAAAEADGLVFVRALSMIPSKGQRALSTTLAALFGGIPVPPQTQTLVEVGVVDARSGKLLTLRAGVVTGAVLKEMQQVANHAVAKALRDFPRSGEPSPWGRKVLKRRAEGKEPPPPEIPSTEAAEESDVLSSFEQAYAKSEAVTSGPSAQPEAEPSIEGAPAAVAALPPEPEAPAAAQAEPAVVASSDVNVPAPPVVPPPPQQPETEVIPIAPALDASPPAGPDVRALFETLPAARPAPTAVISLQVRDGLAGLTLRNRLDKSVRVSLNLGAWQELATGAELVTRLLERNPWIVVIDEHGTELARTACPPAATRTVIAEVEPR